MRLANNSPPVRHEITESDDPNDPDMNSHQVTSALAGLQVLDDVMRGVRGVAASGQDLEEAKGSPRLLEKRLEKPQTSGKPASLASPPQADLSSRATFLRGSSPA